MLSFSPHTCQIATPSTPSACEPRRAAEQNTFQMARKRKTDASSLPSSPMTATRRRSTLRDLHVSAVSDGHIITPKIINAKEPLEKAEMYGIDDARPVASRLLALAARIFIETIPQWLAVGAMLGLIFGGCCSNVSV